MVITQKYSMLNKLIYCIYNIFYRCCTLCSAFILTLWLLNQAIPLIWASPQMNCSFGQIALEVVSAEYGAQLKVDGENYGPIPVPAFCVDFGLHRFSIERNEPSEPNQTWNHVMVWIPKQAQVQLDLTQINLGHRPAKETAFKPDNLSSKATARLQLLSELAILPQSFLLKDSNQALAILNTQGFAYRSLPNSTYQLNLELIGTRDLSRPQSLNRPNLESSLYAGSPWDHTFRLLVQEAYVGRSLGSQSPVKVLVGRMKFKEHNRQQTLDGVLLSWSDKRVNPNLKETNTERPSFKLWTRFSLLRSHSIDSTLNRDRSVQSLNDLWSELGTAFGFGTREKGQLKLTLLGLKLFQEQAFFSNSPDSNTLDAKVKQQDQSPSLIAFKGIWRQAKPSMTQRYLFHISMNQGSQLSQTAAEYQFDVLGAKKAKHFRMFGTVLFRAGDVWDQSWALGQVWANAYRKPMAQTSHAVTWYDLTLTFAQQYGSRPFWQDSFEPQLIQSSGTLSDFKEQRATAHLFGGARLKRVFLTWTLIDKEIKSLD